MAAPKLENGQNTGRLTIALPDSMERWVSEKAEEGECTKGAIVRRLIRAALRAEAAKNAAKNLRRDSL